MNSQKGVKIKNFLVKNNIYIIFLVLFIICSLLSDNFLSVMNLRNIALQQVAPICIALGMLFVILTGGIDLSVGSIMALGAGISAILIRDFGCNTILAILITVLVGTILGTVTGCLVAYAKMQGFVASLAMMTIARGIAYVVTDGTPIRVQKGTLSVLVDSEHFFLIIPIVILFILAFWVIQKYTSYGRLVIALGSNVKAVDLAGIQVKKHLVSVYSISGAMSAFAGIVIAARSSTGSATIGVGWELNAIAACVIGGASLAGGKGFVFPTVIGALVLALIGNIMNLMAVPSYPQDIIKGIIIVAAVLLQLFTNKKSK